MILLVKVVLQKKKKKKKKRASRVFQESPADLERHPLTHTNYYL